MAISVGAYVFEDRTTVVRETYEAVGGKETRLLTITGLIRGAADSAALDASLDALLAAASMEAPVYVSVRSGRRLLARRESFTREVSRGALTGQFVLALRAEQPWEESAAATVAPWVINASGSTVDVYSGGNGITVPVITLDAAGTLIAPRLSDGAGTLAYDGLVEGGSQLVVDGEAGKVLLDGEDITAYTTGDFPRLHPGTTTLTYTDDPSSSHLVDAEIAFRDRWW